MESGTVQLGTVPAMVFFKQLLTNTKEGFFADPMYGGNHTLIGWKMIGFPGANTSEQTAKIGKAMGAETVTMTNLKPGTPFNTTYYQTTHTTGGAIMGTDPKTSAVNRYLQSWDTPNVFVVGASAFPQNMGYNPTGLVGALAYWSVHHIKNTYLKNPGPLMPA